MKVLTVQPISALETKAIAHFQGTIGAPQRVKDCTMATVSRRRFLELVGAAGGSTAVYRAASALGLMAAPGAMPLADLQPLQGAKRKVLILGAGIGGLTAAYELRKVG